MNILMQQNIKAFFCYSSAFSKFVIQVASLLKPFFQEIFCYEEHHNTISSFVERINSALLNSTHFVVFIGDPFTQWQEKEVKAISTRNDIHLVKVFLMQNGVVPAEPNVLKEHFDGREKIEIDPKEPNSIYKTAWEIKIIFGFPGTFDGLPNDFNLFSYEKDIIAHFLKVKQYEKDIFHLNSGHYTHENKEIENIRKIILGGCPLDWPSVRYIGKNNEGPLRSFVTAAALTKYHGKCMIENKMYFPEALSQSPDTFIINPDQSTNILKVAILVAGGIAPGINAVIDGIVRRHYDIANTLKYNLHVYGLKNGLAAINLSIPSIEQEAVIELVPGPELMPHNQSTIYTALHNREGGSIIGTSRLDDLIKDPSLVQKVARAFLSYGIKIVYIIGGDGSMRLAHALWHHANWNQDKRCFGNNLSVVAIPKTMDNDILWVWQSFGFLSAVEKAIEILTTLDTEVKSNPRLCILQLFGSDSGFVVSHTVAASRSDQCDAALIPEVPFSLIGLAEYLKIKMTRRRMQQPCATVPYGFVVMSETAIPTDALVFIEDFNNVPKDLQDDWQTIYQKIIRRKKGFINLTLKNFPQIINLTKEEKDAIYSFYRLRKCGQRMQGQTSDNLRSAGLKIVSRGLLELIQKYKIRGMNEFGQPDWKKLRIVVNEPRHVLRSIDPTCIDIIIGHRLGTLAVDNAMLGYTDFMISQWLTEYVLVPLQLVVLGRKRIPMQGMFWKSVLARTGQPANLDIVGIYPF